MMHENTGRGKADPPKAIPYGRQSIGPDDIEAVVRVLEGDWLTTGPSVDRFEEAVAEFSGARHGVAVCNGTAALHMAMEAIGIGEGDEVIVPPITFVATANAVVFQRGRPMFADVLDGSLLLDPAAVEAAVTPRTKAILAVDYAGQPCDYQALRALADRRGLRLIADACHALGAEYRGRKVGSLADITLFSFHPVKHVTTGEGGMAVTDDPDLARRMKRFRNHGISTDHRQRTEKGTFAYAMEELGYNYRITDFQCALGASQLSKLPAWLERRRRIAGRYDGAFASSPGSPAPLLRPLAGSAEARHAYHLYVVRLALDRLAIDRAGAFAELRKAGIGANVHYFPVHLQPFYRKAFGTREGLCPVAEAAYEEILSLPMYHGMQDEDVERVVTTVTRVLADHAG